MYFLDIRNKTLKFLIVLDIRNKYSEYQKYLFGYPE